MTDFEPSPLGAQSSQELEAQLRDNQLDQVEQAALSAALTDRLTAELMAAVESVPGSSSGDTDGSARRSGKSDRKKKGTSDAATPPAWHPDPTGRFRLRWWDGQAWTEHVADDGQRTIDPRGARM